MDVGPIVWCCVVTIVFDFKAFDLTHNPAGVDAVSKYYKVEILCFNNTEDCLC